MTAVTDEAFAAERSRRWQRLDELTRKAGRRRSLTPSDALEFAALYREVAADLATARLRHPGVSGRLDELVAAAYGRLYGTRRTRLRTVAQALTSGFPARVRAMRWFLAVATALLLVPAAVFYVYGVVDPGGARSYLPSQYQRAADRPPPGARESDVVEGGALSAGIFTNNIRVTFLVFALGVTLGLGTAAMLVLNGMLLGALAGVLAARGIHGAFWVLILPHGVLELSCIAVGGACGLRLGWAIVDPGPLPRVEAVARAGRDAVAVAAALVVPLVVAGLVEGYVTPSTLPGPVRIAIGVILGLAFWTWMIWGGRSRRR